MKRVIAVILSGLTLFSLCSCEVMDKLSEVLKEKLRTVSPISDSEKLKTYLSVEPRELTYNEGYTPVESRYSYNALPLEGEKRLYNALLEAYLGISPDKDEELGLYPMPEIKLEGCSLSEAEVRTAMKAVSDDNPEYFWPGGTIGYYSSEDETIIRPYTGYSAEEVDSRIEKIRLEAEKFFATVPDGLSEYERELMVHDYLIENVEYDESVRNGSSDINKNVYSAYGALVEKKAVCEGYARSFQLLLNGLGVDCVGIMGTGEGELHIWNSVKLDGKWYNVDVTWDDQEQKYARYLYFNVTDEYLKADHTDSPLFDTLSEDEINGSEGENSADVMNIFIPSCTDSTMSWYYRETPHFKDYNATELQYGLLSCAEKKEDTFFFYIEDNFDYQEALDILFNNYPQYFFGYVDNVNRSLEDYSIDKSNLGYYLLDRCRSVAVTLKYY